MQLDFHYYATYCASLLAGYTHEDAEAIGYSSQFVDCCSKTYLKSIDGPRSAASTQLQLEMMEQRTDILGLQDITRIWASFHFLPYDLYAKLPNRSINYMSKYRLICDTNSELLVKTVELAKGSNVQSVGIAMHVLADTWAHRYFCGTPSLIINNTDFHFYELTVNGDKTEERQIDFNNNPATPDDIDRCYYTNSLFQGKENAIMNLGHGRAGHLPDYSFMRYKYLPAWGDYKEMIKDNPSDYMHAFRQMVYAMKYLRGEYDSFEKNTYDTESVDAYEDQIMAIIEKRQLNACDDWKAFGEELSGKTIRDFDVDEYRNEYVSASEEDKDSTFLGKFIIGSLAQKSMVTNQIYKSGNLHAGFSADYSMEGFKGIKDFIKLVEIKTGGKQK